MTPDPTRPSDGGPSRNRLLLLSGLVAWVVVTVIAAGRESREPALIGVENMDRVVFGVLVILAVVGLVLIVVVNPFQSEWTEPPPRRGSLGFLLLFLAALALLLWRPEILENLVPEAETVEEEAISQPQPVDETDRPSPETVAEATDILVVVAVVAVLAAGVIALRHRTKPAAPRADDALSETELLAAIEEAHLALDDNPDPRAGVLRAYRTLEQALESHDAGRRRTETTAEHITRSLRAFAVNPAPVIELSELYHLARYSSTPITAEQQASARRALGAAKDGLAASGPSAGEARTTPPRPT